MPKTTQLRTREGESKDFLGFIHPGDVLREEFLEPLDLTQAQLAEELGVTKTRLNEICKRKRGISAETAIRLAIRFDTSPQFWLNLQSLYDLEKAKQNLDVKSLSAGILSRLKDLSGAGNPSRSTKRKSSSSRRASPRTGKQQGKPKSSKKA